MPETKQNWVLPSLSLLSISLFLPFSMPNAPFLCLSYYLHPSIYLHPSLCPLSLSPSLNAPFLCLCYYLILSPSLGPISLCLFITLPLSLSLFLSVCQSIYLIFTPSLSLTHPLSLTPFSVYLTISFSLPLSAPLFVCLYFSSSPSVCLAVGLSHFLFPSLSPSLTDPFLCLSIYLHPSLTLPPLSVCLSISFSPNLSAPLPVCLSFTPSHTFTLTHARTHTLPCSIKDNDLKGIAAAAADASLFESFQSFFSPKFQKLWWIQKPQKDQNRKFAAPPFEDINSFGCVDFKRNCFWNRLVQCASILSQQYF